MKPRRGCIKLVLGLIYGKGSEALTVGVDFPDHHDRDEMHISARLERDVSRMSVLNSPLGSQEYIRSGKGMYNR